MPETETDTATLYEPFAIQEIYLDGFSGVHVSGANIRATAFSMQPDGHTTNPVAVVRLVMPGATAKLFADQVTAVLAKKAG